MAVCLPRSTSSIAVSMLSIRSPRRRVPAPRSPGAMALAWPGRRDPRWPRRGLAVGLFPFGQQPRADPGHRADARQQDQAATDVVEQVEADDHALGAVIQAVHPQHERVEHRDDQQQADQFVQQAAQGHLASGGVLHVGAEEGEHAAADVGADHQADGHVQAGSVRRRPGWRSAVRREAGVGNHRATTRRPAHRAGCRRSVRRTAPSRPARG